MRRCHRKQKHCLFTALRDTVAPRKQIGKEQGSIAILLRYRFPEPSRRLCVILGDTLPL